MLVSILAAYTFEIASLFVSVAALVYAALALKAAKKALQVTKEADIATLRHRASDVIFSAERSFHKLEEACLLARGQWEQHIEKHYPVLGRSFDRHGETAHIAELERKGRGILQELKGARPVEVVTNTDELEQYIKQAQAASMQIERLAFGLETPRH